MSSQTITIPQERLNDVAEKDKTAQRVSFSSDELSRITSPKLSKLYDLAGEMFSPSWPPLNMQFNTQTPQFELNKKINTPAYIWLSYAAELIALPFLTVQPSEERYSVEIVKRYSLSEIVEKTYFSQVSYYVSVDIVVNTENISDKQFETFFEYEKQLLNMFNLPINFNYHLNNSFNTHPENVLIFEK